MLTAPADATFVGATLQRSGSVLLHMNSTDAATWLKANMPSFLLEMGGTSVYKERLLNVVVQYVPVSLDPTQDGALRVLESENNLLSGSLVKVRWIKPIAQRHAHQKVAHAIFGFGSANAANTFLRHGMWVEGKPVHGHKLLPEPIRCLKCQGVGLNHIAANCPSIHDVCARCGGMHRTATCGVDDDARACANCRNARQPHEGHGVADRACPIFTDKLQFALERNPDAKYPYFPLADNTNSW
ncbi:hypothetical protein C8F04DRAFT_972372, partial [Mycena alexandri]